MYLQDTPLSSEYDFALVNIGRLDAGESEGWGKQLTKGRDGGVGLEASPLPLISENCQWWKGMGWGIGWKSSSEGP